MKKKKIQKDKPVPVPITNPCVICGEESVEGNIVCRQCEYKYGEVK